MLPDVDETGDPIDVGDLAARVLAALESKWRDVGTVADDPLAPWMTLHEISATADAPQLAVKRVLRELAADAPSWIMFEPADVRTNTPARWVMVPPRPPLRLRSSKPPAPANEGMLTLEDDIALSAQHITSEYSWRSARGDAWGVRAVPGPEPFAERPKLSLKKSP